MRAPARKLAVRARESRPGTQWRAVISHPVAFAEPLAASLQLHGFGDTGSPTSEDGVRSVDDAPVNCDLELFALLARTIDAVLIVSPVHELVQQRDTE